jgi:hypothetical protein
VPTYDWRCKYCGETIEVTASIKERDVPPEVLCKNAVGGISVCGWERIISSATPVMWEDARDKGVFDRHYRWPT